MKREQYNNPPIKEAIFTLHFNENIDKDKLVLFRESEFVKTELSIISPILNISLLNQSSSRQNQSLVTSQKEEGYTLKKSEEENNLVRVLPSHISYHNFNKYAGWEGMFSDLQKIWLEFCKVIGENALAKISVRYINQLALPNESEVSDYIKLLPSVPNGINALNNFFIQIRVPSNDDILQGIITETMLPNVADEKNEIFLIDLTVSKSAMFECNSNDIWSSFNEIREFKNELFFNCITDKTIELFN